VNPTHEPSSEPDAPIVVGHREQLFHLIAEACEIEHTLMCSYVYAAFSLKTGDSGLRAEEADAVARWRASILSVATEEMVHLLLMANLSIALGGRPHFSRPNFPVAPGYFPSGVVVKLTPFSMDTLEHFIFLERPETEERSDGDGFAHDQEYRREEAHIGLMPSVQDYSTVGRLYRALRLNLIAAAARMGEEQLFVGPVGGQVGPDDLKMEGVRTIADLRGALEAIATIVEQGEGSNPRSTDSHYQRFLAIQREYAALLQSNPGFAPAWPSAENPVMRRPPEPEDKVFIDDPSSAQVLDVANAVYGLLLRFLVQAFGREKAHAAQSRFLGCAIDLMHALARVGSVLAQLPASPSQPGINAGLTFTMLRSVEPLFAGPAEQALTLERLREVANGARPIASVHPLLRDLHQSLHKVADSFSSAD
jgi:hypothetical protein